MLDVVLGLDVASDSSLRVPDERNLEAHTRGGGRLYIESGAVDGEILAQEVIGGLSEVLKWKNALETEQGVLMIAVPSRRVGLVEEEPFGFSGEEEELWEVASSRLILALAFMPGAPSWAKKLARFTARIGQTNRMVKYITPQELEALIKSQNNDYLVVDVRDDDYRGGNIKGGINIPSEKFLLKLHQLIDDTQNVSKIIFHCALSQQRWVSLTYTLSRNSLSHTKEVQRLREWALSDTVHAGSLRLSDQIYTEARLLQEGAADIEYEVFVLKGGFADFQRLFRVSGFVNLCHLLLTLRFFRTTPNWSKTGTNERGIRFRRP